MGLRIIIIKGLPPLYPSSQMQDPLSSLQTPVPEQFDGQLKNSQPIPAKKGSQRQVPFGAQDPLAEQSKGQGDIVQLIMNPGRDLLSSEEKMT